MTTNETNHSIHDGRPWLLWRYGAEECAFSPLLKSAYSAVSTAYAGLSLNNKHFTRSAARTYSYVLKSLQKALNNPETGKSDAVLMTVGLCMNYEVSIRICFGDSLFVLRFEQARLSRESKAGYSVHVTGVLKLFEYRGPSLQRSGLAHYFFVDTRLYCVHVLSSGDPYLG